jgi:hypothetical protein
MSRDIHFHGHPALRKSGSSYLRSWELCAMARADARFRGLRLAVTTSVDDLDDSIVILNKSALAALQDEDFDRLKNRRNILIADPLDAVLPDALLAKFDCVIAAALGQLAYYRGAVATRTSYIAHHIDTRIPPIVPRPDRFSIGYFGEFTNARYTRELRGSVSFVDVDTKTAEDTRWMNELANHNAHYLIRARDEPGSFKPFTKGFIAAHCASPVLVARDDLEARHYLPASYPYRADADQVEDVRRAILRMRDGFMAAEWRLAQECMRGILECCSTATVTRQIYETVAAYL